MTNRSTLKRRLLAAGLAVPLLATSALALAQGAGTPAAPPPPAAGPAAAPVAPAAPERPGPAATRVDIGELRDMSAIELQGRVAERFGNAFVLEDATGRTLVETGPQGEHPDLLSVGDEVTVEGRFERGQIQATALTVAGGERMAIERPRPDRDGPRGPARGGPGAREHGPRGPGGEGREQRGERRGGWFSGDGVDVAAAETALGAAGYSEVALVDTKRHHAEFTAQDASGAEWLVKVDEDNEVTERRPYAAPLSEDAARAAIEALGYSYDGDFEVEADHVEADARDAGGRSVRVELAADGSLRKERFDD